MFTIGAVFWIVFLVALIVDGWRERGDIRGWFFSSIIWWVLLFLLGVGTFGFPVKI